MDKFRVIIVDDMLALREGLLAILGQVQGLEMAKACENGEQALIEIRRTEYDLALIDLQLNRENGIELGRALNQLRPNLKVIIYTRESSIIIAAEIFHRGHFKSGRESLVTTTVARPRSSNLEITRPLTPNLYGYMLLKNITPFRLDQILQQLNQKSDVIDPEIIDLKARFKQHALTPREMQCIELVSMAKSNREIAQYLGISQQAVENLINSLYNKLSIGGQPKDPGRRVMLAMTMQHWKGVRQEVLELH